MLSFRRESAIVRPQLDFNSSFRTPAAASGGLPHRVGDLHEIEDVGLFKATGEVSADGRILARDSPPDLLDQFFSNRWPKPRVIR